MLSVRTFIAATAVLCALVPAGAALAAPTNDLRANALNLLATGDSHSGDTTTATYTQTDQFDRLGTGTHSVWYRWTAPKAGLVTFETDAAFDAVLNTYADDTACCRWRSNDDDGPGTNARIAMYVSAGQKYLIAVDGYDPLDYGSYTVKATFDDTPPPPLNDAFAKPAPLVSAQQVSEPMELQFATEETGEPDHGGLGGSRSLWFTWTAPKSGGVNLDVSCSTSSSFMAHRPTVAAYTGTTLANVVPVAATRTNDHDSCTDEFLQFQATQGVQYRFAVDAAPGFALGAVTLTVDQDIEAPTIDFGTQKVFGPYSKVPFTSSSDTYRSQCKVDGGAEFYCPAYIALGGAAKGDHTLQVRSVDNHGNWGDWASRTFEVDGTAPESKIDSSPGKTTRDTNGKVTFSASEADATFECRIDKTGVFLPCTSPYTTSYRDHGFSAVVEVRAVDKWGNAEPEPSIAGWIVDRYAPQIFSVGNTPVANIGESLTWGFKSDDPSATFECALDGAAYAPCTSPYTAPGVGYATTRSLMVRATDPAGNTAQMGFSGHQKKPFAGATIAPVTPKPTTPAPTTGRSTPGTGTTAAAPTQQRQGFVRGGLRITALRAPRTVTRAALAKRGLTARVRCAPSCSVVVELRAGKRVIARGSGRTTIRVKPLKGAAKRIKRLKRGTRLTLSTNLPGAPVRSTSVRVSR